MKPDHISQRMQRQCGVPRHLVDRLPIERQDHSVAWQASLPQHPFRRPRSGFGVRVSRHARRVVVARFDRGEPAALSTADDARRRGHFVAPFDAPGCLGRIGSRRSDPAFDVAWTGAAARSVDGCGCSRRSARARPGGTAGRDAQGSSKSRQLRVTSLPGPIPVPQCSEAVRDRGCSCQPSGRVNAPAACLRSDRAADGRRGWLR